MNILCCQVSVPCSNIFAIVTVRCGHCSNLLSVSMQSSLQPLPLQDPQVTKYISGVQYFMFTLIFFLIQFVSKRNLLKQTKLINKKSFGYVSFLVYFLLQSNKKVKNTTPIQLTHIQIFREPNLPFSQLITLSLAHSHYFLPL